MAMSMGDMLNEPAENFGNDVRILNISVTEISFFHKCFINTFRRMAIVFFVTNYVYIIYPYMWKIFRYFVENVGDLSSTM